MGKCHRVRVISKARVRQFVDKHPEASAAFFAFWLPTVQAAQWNGPADVRRTFNSADFVEDLTVFNVGGNKYRVIAYLHYRLRAVYLKAILTHDEYSKGAWKR